MQAPQLRAGLDADLLDERRPRLAVGVQRIGLPPGAVQREHALGVEALAQRLLAHEPVELADDLPVAPGGEIALDRVLERRQPELLEPPDLRRRERFAGTSCSGGPCQSASASRASPRSTRCSNHCASTCAASMSSS